MTLPLIVDAHQDLAWNARTFGRDYTQSALETRAREQAADSWAVAVNGQCTIGLPELLRGQVAFVFSTLFAAPRRRKASGWSGQTPAYATLNEARDLYAQQLDDYYRLVDTSPVFTFVTRQSDIDRVLASWGTPDERLVGLVPLMEGADAIRQPKEAEWWWERGLRIVGLAWTRTRYAGGTGQPGPLTREGRRLLAAMADLGLILDLSHASDEAYLEAIERFEGVVIASHANPRACLNNPPRPERFLTDDMIKRMAERQGVMGIVPYNAFLSTAWQLSDGKAPVTLDHVTMMIDHICQLTGSAAHVGIGSDFDGGFGAESLPAEMDTVADLQKIGPALAARGYTPTDIAAILGGNWLSILRRGLPA